jgi:hypothetical protein
MYGGVADLDSEVVFLGLAPDNGRRSLASESTSPSSTPGASLGSTTFASAQAVMMSGFGIARLLHPSEFPHTRLSHCRVSMRVYAQAHGCPREIVHCEVPVAQSSARASSTPLHAECSTAGPDQEAR